MNDLEKSEIMALDEIHRYELPVSYSRLCEILEEQNYHIVDEKVNELEDENDELRGEVEELESEIEELKLKVKELEKEL